MSTLTARHCSWCFQPSEHQIQVQNYVRRNVYECQKCENLTLQCAAGSCKHMAKGGEKWDHNFCAEHDGSIASFARLGMQLSEIDQFETIFKRDSRNMVQAGKIAGGAVAGALVFTPLAFFGAPGVATALGGAGILGAAGTGTSIASLSGVALTNASLAAIGAGTMSGGVGVISATGIALGAYKGGVISNSYFGHVKHFKIEKKKPGNKHAVIFVNGFLSQGEAGWGEWEPPLKAHFPAATWYHNDWESTNLHKLGGLLTKNPEIAGIEIAKSIAKRAAKSAAAKLSPLTLATALIDLVDNPWHVAMTKAELTGVMLADAIARTPGWQFTLVGHSLGARVIHYALDALSTKDATVVKNVYLLGGAVGGDKGTDKNWERAAGAVKSKIYNCYSTRDQVLNSLYRPASLLTSKPVGIAPIHLNHPKICNVNCSALVDSHLSWKLNLAKILTQIKQQTRATPEP